MKMKKDRSRDPSSKSIVKDEKLIVWLVQYPRSAQPRNKRPSARALLGSHKMYAGSNVEFNRLQRDIPARKHPKNIGITVTTRTYGLGTRLPRISYLSRKVSRGGISSQSLGISEPAIIREQKKWSA